MNLTIDPDVFASAENGNRCEEILVEIEKIYSEVLFVLDEKLEKKYADFAQDNYKLKSKAVAVSIAKKILNSSLFLRIEHPIDLCICLQQLLQENTCDPLEYHLYRIATQLSRKKGFPEVCIVLNGANDGKNKKCAHHESIRNEIMQQIPGLELILSCDKGRLRYCLNKPAPTNKDQHVKSFEDQCKIIVSNLYDCIPQPKDCIAGVEVDVYCRQLIGNPRMVCVGECKLRFSNEEENLIDISVLKQLQAEMEAVKKYELQQNSPNSDFVLKGFIISNARDLNPNVWKIIEESNGDIVFLRIKMPERWVEIPRWKISLNNIKIISHKDLR